MLNVKKTASVLLVGAMLALSASAVDPSPVSSAPQRDPDVFRLSIWNYDFEWQSTVSSVPPMWRPSSTTITSSLLRAQSVPAPSNFQPGNAAGNRVLWVYDQSRSQRAEVRSTAATAFPGREYSIYTKQFTGSGYPPLMYLEFVDARGRVLKRYKQDTRVPGPGEGWWVKTYGVAPAGTTTFRVAFISSYSGVGSGYFDDVWASERIPQRPPSTRLSTRDVLFIGDQRVESTTLSSVVIAGEKHDPDGRDGADPVYEYRTLGEGEIQPNQPQLYGTVLYDEGVFKMWFTGQAVGRPWSTFYMESNDGISWGQAREVLSDVWVGGVVRNPDQSDPQQRYLMLGVKGEVYVTTPTSNVTYRAYSSPDGVNWRSMSPSPVLANRDVATLSYDYVTGKFFANTKQPSLLSYRQTSLATSTDLVRWTTPRQSIWAENIANQEPDDVDPYDAEVYGAPVFRYGDQLIAIPWIYRRSVVGGIDGPIEPSIAASVDGVRFVRPEDRSPLIPLGAPGELDDGFITTASDLVEVGDRVRLYYGAWDAGHDVTARTPRIFFAEWEAGRFVAMRGDGELTTHEFVPDGSQLVVNARPGTGRLTVEVIDATTGNVVPGFSASESTVIRGDELRVSVGWGGRDVGDAVDAVGSIQLRFVLTGGDLFGFAIV